MTYKFNNTDDLIDVRDMIERYEELEAINEEDRDDDEREELRHLQDALDQMKDYGGDEQWRGDWYPITLIRESYFEDYAQELAEDIGAVDPNAQWPMCCIDWQQAARELRMDYTSAELDGVTYWFR